MGTLQCSCYTVYRYPPVSSNQLFHPRHSCFCRNLNRETWSGICDFRTPLREFFYPAVKPFTRQTLPTVNRTHFSTQIIWFESLCVQKTHNRTLLFISILLKHGRHIDYWNQPLNMSMRVCYLNYYEGGLCYLMIHIENLLHPLELFYFHLCPICLLSFLS
jgi:hypothetical protein